MRLLVPTLIASSSRPVRHQPPALFGETQPLLAIEEYKALSGVWRTDLELDIGHVSASVHLADPQSQQIYDNAPQQSQADADFPQGGRAYFMDERLPYRIWRRVRSSTPAWWSVSRSVHAGAEDDDILGISVLLGNLYLEGRGQRGGLRCRTFVGKVFEGGSDEQPRRVGRFSMRLSLPINADSNALAQRYHDRIK